MMTKKIELPVILGFDTDTLAQSFLDGAEVIIPKLQMEKLGTDPQTGKQMYLYFANKGKLYKQMYSDNIGYYAEKAPQFTDDRDEPQAPEGWTVTGSV